jgi:hypothetical protein
MWVGNGGRVNAIIENARPGDGAVRKALQRSARRVYEPFRSENESSNSQKL